MGPDITIVIEDKAWLRVLPRAEELARTAALAALKSEGWGRRKASIDITLLTDKAQKVLNRDWRGKDKSTNVLSFPMDGPEAYVPRGMPRQLGDMTLARETMVREAKEQFKTLEAHFVHLITHGVLHLLGYDHMTAREAKVMEGKEIKLLVKAGYGDPYADTDSTKLRAALK